MLSRTVKRKQTGDKFRKDINRKTEADRVAMQVIAALGGLRLNFNNLKQHKDVSMIVIKDDA